MKTIFWISPILLFLGFIEGANILILLPLPLFSQTNTFLPVFKELASRGHNITMVSPYPQKKTISNWTDYTVGYSSQMNEALEKFMKEAQNRSVYTFYPHFWEMCRGMMEAAYKEETLQYFIKAENLNFDLVITQVFFAHESLVAFGHKFNVPVIAIHPISLSPWPAFLTGNELTFSLLPNYRSPYTDHMTFFQRLDNALINMIELFTGYYTYLPKQDKLMEDYMIYPGSKNRPDMITMLKNVSLTLLDYHNSIGYPNTMQANSIPVGGLSIKHAGELPNDLKEILDNSKNGVVYLSFGSLVKGDTVLLDLLLKVFKELDETVIMKWSEENVPNKPKNVVLRKWLPQASLLAHPNVRLFISHGGLHGITESSNFGVPILGIPFFSDQKFNTKFIESIGCGIQLLQENLTKENLQKHIIEILKNPSYKENAVKRSKIVQDRPNTAIDSSVFWIEYVLRHKGAKHLRPARLDLSLYELLYLDIIFYILFITLITLLLVIIIKLL